MVKQQSDWIAQVADEANLLTAWRAVRRNKGEAGLDDVSLQAFQAHLVTELSKIRHTLHLHTYQPNALKRVTVRKRNLRPRIIGIPTVADRVVQHAILQILEPLFEPSFCSCSYGFRPGRSAHQAVQAVVTGLLTGLSWVVEADLQNFFDSLDWTILRQALQARVHDPHVLNLIHRFLLSGALHGHQATPSAQGAPQGVVFSPLLANTYLDVFDRQMLAQGYHLTRYADDFLTLHGTKEEAIRALHLMREVLETRLKLRLHATKTGIRHASHEPLEFLGFRISIHSLVPTPQAIERFKTRVRAIVRARRGQGIAATAAQLNPLIRGWGEYFKIGQVSDLYQQLDQWVATQIGKPLHPGSDLASLTALRKRRRSGNAPQSSL